MQTPQSVIHALNPNARTASGRRLTPKIHLFDKIIEILLADGDTTIKDIAQRLGRSQPWVTYIMHSDAFRDLYEHRRTAHNAQLSQQISETLTRVTQKALGSLDEVMTKNPAKVTPQMALDIASMGLEKLGYGVKLPGIPITQVNVNVSQEDFKLAQSVVRAVDDGVLVPASRVSTDQVDGPPAPHAPREVRHVAYGAAIGGPSSSNVTPLRDILASIELDEPNDDDPPESVSISGEP